MTTVAIDQAPDSVARPRTISPLEYGLFCLFIGAFAFDFRSSEPGGHWVHYVYLSVSTLSFIALFLALAQRKARPGVYELGSIPLVLGVLIPAYALFGALYNNVPLGNFARLELRYILFFEAVVLVYLLGRAGIAVDFIIKLILITAVIGLIWQIYYTLELQVFRLANARYRLAPIFTVSIIGASVGAIFTGRLLYLPPLLFALLAIQLSSTRSLLAALGALYLVMHVYALAGRERRKLIALAIFDGVLVAFLLYLYSRGYFDNWIMRFILNETGKGDATLLIRFAEYQSQWNIVSSSWGKTIFGAGLGSNYDRDLSVMRYAILSRHTDLEDTTTFEFGHSLYIYSAYYGGILGGWMVPFIFLAAFVKSARNAFRSHRNGDEKRYMLDLQINAIVVQVLVTGLFAHPFGSRLFCVHFGLLAALAFVYPLAEEAGRTEAPKEPRRRRVGRAPAYQSGAFT